LTTILTALDWETKFTHIATFQIKGRMDVSVERDVNIRMTKDFTERFDVKAYLNAPCRKSMARSVEICIINSAIPNVLFEVILHCPWFNIPAFVTGQDKGFWGTFKTLRQIENEHW